MKIIFRKGENLHIFSLGKTTNKKICGDPKQKIVQSYVFSMEQYEQVVLQAKDVKDFYSKANTNCLDCPMREYGKCYTHKYMQTMGFMSMLRSVVKTNPTWDSIPKLSKEIETNIINISIDRYIRFGTYGEPVLHGLDLVKEMTSVAKAWTGYTHQWKRYPPFAEFFMASVHTPAMELKAKAEGWRSFITLSSPSELFVNCPASKEGGMKTSCDKCGLCSGQSGKGKKSVFILEH